ncbi:MAG: alpha/beta hydrolase [Proteobacteria bacterium]|nr:alpha/beta hydrolase [Pseudomonadota bacterium]
MDITPLITTATPALEARFLEPDGFKWGHFTARDGARLRWGHLPAGTADDCILLGGYIEFIEKYFEAARDFHRRGFNVWCLDWRGQGRSARSGRTKPDPRLFDRDADDLAQFVAAVSPRDHKRLLVAHSMGGAISLLALANHAPLVDAAVLSAPMIQINTGGVPRCAARALAFVMSAIGQGDSFVPGASAWPNLASRFGNMNRLSNHPVRGKLVDAWFTAAEDLRHDGPTYAWLKSAFALTTRISKADLLARVRTPILIGSAGNDLLVDAAAHLRAAALLPDGRLVTFATAKHELFQETDDIRDRWFAAIDSFVAEHIRPT